VRYLLYLPGDYGKDPKQQWPLILFLHGSGSIGNDLNLLKNAMLPWMLETKTDFPFIVISPQLPGPGAWTSEQSATQIQDWSPLIDPLNVLLDQLPAQYAVDTQRLYLTGLSLGGFGTWEFALRYPQRFAAIVPVAGGYLFNSSAIPPGICTLKDLPVWVFYGGQDTVVQPVQSSSMIKALQDCGGNVHATFYPDATHEQTWQRAYIDPALWQWLLQQSKP
jgi:predicted peptidase